MHEFAFCMSFVFCYMEFITCVFHLSLHLFCALSLLWTLLIDISNTEVLRSETNYPHQNNGDWHQFSSASNTSMTSNHITSVHVPSSPVSSKILQFDLRNLNETVLKIHFICVIQIIKPQSISNAQYLAFDNHKLVLYSNWFPLLKLFSCFASRLQFTNLTVASASTYEGYWFVIELAFFGTSATRKSVSNVVDLQPLSNLRRQT